jgi:cytochrome c oxidase subunit 3
VHHFTQNKHIGYETAAWYWHFVDIVWIFLFISVYIWAGEVA